MAIARRRAPTPRVPVRDCRRGRASRAQMSRIKLRETKRLGPACRGQGRFSSRGPADRRLVATDPGAAYRPASVRSAPDSLAQPLDEEYTMGVDSAALIKTLNPTCLNGLQAA